MSDATSPPSPAPPSLGPSAFIVLGLLAQFGPGTSYDLKRWADSSVGFFWTFPRSQLYAEPQRLVTLGLLAEKQEAGGRRRRTFAVTVAGRAALREWLSAPAGVPELRDLGLLKLFFMSQGDPDALGALAAEQWALHCERLSVYETLTACPQPEAPEGVPLQTLQMGLLYERASLAFWSEVQAGGGTTPGHVLSGITERL